MQWAVPNGRVVDQIGGPPIASEAFRQCRWGQAYRAPRWQCQRDAICRVVGGACRESAGRPTRRCTACLAACRMDRRSSGMPSHNGLSMGLPGQACRRSPAGAARRACGPRSASRLEHSGSSVRPAYRLWITQQPGRVCRRPPQLTSADTGGKTTRCPSPDADSEPVPRCGASR